MEVIISWILTRYKALCYEALTFLLFYIVAKGFQFDAFSFVWFTVEGIGIVYLLDTYFEKCQNCKEMEKYEEKS